MSWPKGHALYVEPRKGQPADADIGEHGIGGYRRGCRCRTCKAAWSAAQRKWRRKVRKLPVPEQVHGTINGYKIYGCRCDACKAVHSEANQRARDARKRLQRLAAAGLPRDWEGDIPA